MDKHSEFIKRTKDRYLKQCVSEDVLPSIDGLLQFMLQKGFVPEYIVNRLVVVDMYPLELNTARSKTDAVENISCKVGVCQAQVFNIIKNYPKSFR